MADSAHEQIARLESEIEALAEAAARCAKIAVAAQIAISAGGVVFAAILLRMIYADALPRPRQLSVMVKSLAFTVSL